MSEIMKTNGVRLAVLVGLAIMGSLGGASQAHPQTDGSDEDEAVERARLSLAGEIGVPAENVLEEGVSFQRFPNGAMGCPRPGEASTMMVTPGWRVILRVEEDLYDVRVAEATLQVRVCGKVGTPVKKRPSAAVQRDVRAASGAASAARVSLAERLGVEETAVRRVWARPVRWPEGPRDCGTPEPMETGSGATDFLVLLEHEGAEYEYRVDREGPVPCEDEDGGDAAP